MILFLCLVFWNSICLISWLDIIFSPFYFIPHPHGMSVFLKEVKL